MRIMHPPVYSMARTPGLRKVQAGWKDRSLFGRTSRRATMPSTPEQNAKADAYLEVACAALEAGNSEAFFAAIRDREAPKPQGEQSLDRNHDREARIAIEGDTAMDDVPFGEKGE